VPYEYQVGGMDIRKAETTVCLSSKLSKRDSESKTGVWVG